MNQQKLCDILTNLVQRMRAGGSKQLYQKTQDRSRLDCQKPESEKHTACEDTCNSKQKRQRVFWHVELVPLCLWGAQDVWSLWWISWRKLLINEAWKSRQWVAVIKRKFRWHFSQPLAFIRKWPSVQRYTSWWCRPEDMLPIAYGRRSNYLVLDDESSRLSLERRLSSFLWGTGVYYPDRVFWHLWGKGTDWPFTAENRNGLSFYLTAAFNQRSE